MLLNYLLQTIVLVTIGVILANIFIEAKILSKLTPLVKPICKRSNLSEACIFALFTSLLSPTASKSALATFYNRGDITESEVIVTTLMSTFPMVVGGSLFKVQALITIMILGPIVGSIYITLNFFAAFIQTFWAFIYSKIAFPPCSTSVDDDYQVDKLLLTFDTIKSGLKAAYSVLMRIIPVLTVTVLVIGYLLDHGMMDMISHLFDPVLGLLGIPGECAAALAGQFIHYTVGYAVIGSLLSEGIITEKDAVMTLLIGSMIVITLIYIKFSASMYISLFGKLGVKVALINYASSMLAKVITIGLVLWLM
ncbi:nucleoside recognition protein [Methanosarcinales archaeon]|nr:MAG: nucleoside recognition protein [Methanosarcinales archaeon]